MADPGKTTVFDNVRVLDSATGTVGAPGRVVVEGNLITAVGSRDDLELGDGARIIDGGGRVLMPGLIDAHWHSMFATIPLAVSMRADPGYIHALAGRSASETLLRGFTTVRDAGGPAFGLKLAIDQGVLPGPRIFPSGAMISQTGGHGDFRSPGDIPRGRLGQHSHTDLLGATAVADGVDEVLRAAREQLMLGASQLKLMAGGGVASFYDPLDVTQYTEAELRAAVDAAANWGTYVMVHAYTPRSVQQAIRAGVRSIEHGQLLDDETAALMAEHDLWWSMQPFLDDEDAPVVTGASRVKLMQMITGTDTAYALARKHGVKLAWGTDTLFDPALAARQGAQLAKLVRWFNPAEVITMATLRNAELLELSGPRNPYPAGKLGVIAEGAYADLILVDGNPLDDINLLARPEEAFVMIMKDGQFAKNLL
ncbi:amidohydrolase family protein [Microlunatus elymi]|uniref:Amidohydrolase family protein n=2 Tax=Microlunatus elymi TaxID=2596828 RepID=A0A516Q600_9ACTN|nr:amidohydrolase family protein [Microlunatus elymi]